MSRSFFRSLVVVSALMAGWTVLDASARTADKEEAGKPIVLFNGKDLTGWKFKKPDAKANWVVGYAALDDKDPRKLVVGDKGEGPVQLIDSRASTDIYTEQKFGDGVIELEFMVPKGSNSGVYVMGEYEVQILDSFGKEKPGTGDLGALYGVFAPKVNAARKPDEWQKFVIDYQAPRFEGDKKVANVKFLKIVLNDQVIHENVELKGPTPSGVTGKEAATGPVMIQGDHGPVALRNVQFTPKK
jgi:Domain of Unknown Function (DUF1080)